MFEPSLGLLIFDCLRGYKEGFFIFTIAMLECVNGYDRALLSSVYLFAAGCGGGV